MATGFGSSNVTHGEDELIELFVLHSVFRAR